MHVAFRLEDGESGLDVVRGAIVDASNDVLRSAWIRAH